MPRDIPRWNQAGHSTDANTIVHSISCSINTNSTRGSARYERDVRDLDLRLSVKNIRSKEHDEGRDEECEEDDL